MVIDTLIAPRYWALGALSALYAFLAESRAITFAPMSQRIVYEAPEGAQHVMSQVGFITGAHHHIHIGTMFIDPDTANNLELVQNAVNPMSKIHLLGATQSSVPQILIID